MGVHTVAIGHRTINNRWTPRDFASVEELHEALAAVHVRWILEVQATLEDPRRPGSWAQGATATGWDRPESTPRPA